MGGGGSGYKFDPGELERRREEVAESARQARLDAEVNSMLSEQLIEFNQRDIDQVNRRLDEVTEALGEEVEGFDRLAFGGSVAKRTYVEGLSDVDLLVVLDSENYDPDDPAQLIKSFEETLRGRLNIGQIREIRTGELAVTVEYNDGAEIQLLPAIDRDGDLSIAGSRGREWLKIDPRSFARRLTSVNQQQAGAVVPAVKLAKAVIAELPESKRLSGYHVEALAVAAFGDYTGPRNPKAMLTRFFDSAASAVKRPISDVTGQSAHVDEKLGATDSAKRRELAGTLRGFARTMAESRSLRSWRKLFGE